MNAPLHVIHSDWTEPNTFDEYDVDTLTGILPLGVAKAVSALLQSRREIQKYNIGNEDAMKSLMPELDRLYTSCLEEWRDL